MVVAEEYILPIPPATILRPFIYLPIRNTNPELPYAYSLSRKHPFRGIPRWLELGTGNESSFPSRSTTPSRSPSPIRYPSTSSIPKQHHPSCSIQHSILQLLAPLLRIT